MKRKTTLLLDVGSQGCRALAVDENGDIARQSSRLLKTREQDGRVEQDADALAAALDEVAAESAGAGIGQAALAVQRGSVVCWDRETGRPLSPVISWRDRRALPESDKLGGKAGEIKRRTGLRFSPYGGAPKLAWCLRKLPEVAAARDAGRLSCGPVGSFLTTRQSGQTPPRVDDTLAQRTLLWSRDLLDWDPWLLGCFSLPQSVLPEVHSSRTAYGTLDSLPGSPALRCLMGDQNTVPFLDGTPDPETLYINLGTGAFLLRPLRTPIETDRFQLSLLDRDNRYALEGSVHGCASALRWLERRSDCKLDPEQMDGLRDRVGSRPPLFLNSIDGLGSPWWRSGPEPAFIGEVDDDSEAFESRLLAVLESIAFLIRANADEMNKLIEPPLRVRLSGGLSRSDTLCSLLADLLGTDLWRLKSGEGTAMGLWCRLHDRAMPEDAFDRIPARGDPGLAQRYRKWLQSLGSAESGN